MALENPKTAFQAFLKRRSEGSDSDQSKALALGEFKGPEPHAVPTGFRPFTAGATFADVTKLGKPPKPSSQQDERPNAGTNEASSLSLYVRSVTNAQKRPMTSDGYVHPPHSSSKPSSFSTAGAASLRNSLNPLSSVSSLSSESPSSPPSVVLTAHPQGLVLAAAAAAA
eukprot:CAMPEP_0175051422 /NCGR_PEP_ID=MMETSP0052_2-20121109/7792_1 /TAXON_ID=51329 ORGANISM="Polytomella parva, Strain SAG 63-3" /NCGR_SAMPLE_ID=MMETSP0052_2 /ASSEMBLY_ACC=CAM_ASM_000194 /LENGTH=168 /DNA_ID=CAMNT_0016315707 /DNA_START=52 /DNA_END=555 /DNA_ORIENTATION=+